MIKPQYYITPGGLAGVESLCVEKELYANQARLDFDETTKTYKPIKLPKYSILVGAAVVIDGDVDGTLKLGYSGSDEAFIADADMPKTEDHSKYFDIKAILQEATTVQFKVAGCSAGSAGKIWLFWRPLI